MGLLMKRIRIMNAEQKQAQLRVDFDRYDTDRSGELDMREVSCLLSDVGLQPRTRQEQDDIVTLLNEADEDGSGTFTLEEFATLVVKVRERLELLTRAKMKRLGTSLGFSEAEF